jgi:4-alpha-glucanotransferase
MPSADRPDAAVLGALKYIGRTRCTIAFAPVEDFAVDPEQANVPGTTDEHPNWRRRMKKGYLFRDKAARRRMRAFVSARRTP